MPYSGWSGEAERRLTARLQLPATGREQDWDVELADPARCSEFVAVYETLADEDDRKALMSLILASYDERLAKDSPDDVLWQRILTHLRDHHSLHEPLVRYWSLVDDVDAEGAFHLTRLVRPLVQP